MTCYSTTSATLTHALQGLPIMWPQFMQRRRLPIKMPADTFCDYVLEQLAALADVRSRYMFGGYGLYCGDLFFGIVYRGRVYFKTHPHTLPDYLRYQSAVFAPSSKQILKNYREVPPDIVEDSERLVAWARKALG